MHFSLGVRDFSNQSCPSGRGLGFRVLGFRVLGCRVSGFGFRV